MVSCALRSCYSRKAICKKTSSGITFHRFPKDPERRKAWTKFVNRGNWEPSNSSSLCSRHFSEIYIDRTSQCVVRLRDNAVPSLHPPRVIMTQCNEVNCDHNNLRDNCDFFMLPTEPELRAKWLQLLRMDPNNVPNLMRICSCHFRDGKKENLPEIFSVNENEEFDECDFSPEPETRKRKSGVRCAVSSCTNFQKKLTAEGNNIRFHTFPKIPEIKEKWIKFCRRIGKWNPATSRICSIHFEKEDYERNLQAELLGIQARPILKKNAVPSLHPANYEDLKGRSYRRIRKGNLIDENVDSEKESNIYNLLNDSAPIDFFSNLDLIQNIKEHNSNIEIEIINDQNQHETDQPYIDDVTVDPRENFQSKDLSVRLVRLDDLDDKYNDLIKEQFLKKHQLTKTKRSSGTAKSDYNSLFRENQLLKDRIGKIGQLSKSLEAKFTYLCSENKRIREELTIFKQKSAASTSTANSHKEELTYEKINYNTLCHENEILKQKMARMGQVSMSLEAKYSKLQEENRLLQQQLDFLKQQPNSTSKTNSYEQEAPSGVETRNVIDLTDIYGVCRICLQKNELLISVDDKIISAQDDFPETRIRDVLQYFGSDPVKISDNTTNKICILCKNQLQQFVTLKYIYKKATSILQLYANGAFGNKTEKCNPNEHNYFKESSANENENVAIKLEYDHLSDGKDGDCGAQNKTDDQNAGCGDANDEIDNKDDGVENYSDTLDDTSKQLDEEEVAAQMSDISYIKNYLSKLNTNKRAKVTHTCPTCWIQLPITEFIPHIKTHKIFKKYLNCSGLPKNARIYAPPRNVEGFLRDGTEKIHSCPMCNEEFKAPEFIMHVDHHLKNDQFSCDKCNRVFKKKAYLLSHILIHNTDFPFRCGTCNKGFVVKDNYECHLLTHKDEEYPHKCTQCEKRFSNPKHLARHMTIHTENRSYSKKYKYLRCKYCSQSFSNRGLLDEHVCQQEGIYACIYCYKGFVSAKARQAHFVSFHKQKIKKSTYCNICKVNVTNIQSHKIKYHGKEKMGALCTVCGLYVVNIYNHMLKHRKLKGKPFKCPICTKQFAYKNLLKRHFETHNGLKPYICSYCAKAFSSQYNMQVHERIHIGNKNHTCPICEKGFLEKSYLNKHLKTHKGYVRNYDPIEHNLDGTQFQSLELQYVDDKIEYLSAYQEDGDTKDDYELVSKSDQECEDPKDDYELIPNSDQECEDEYELIMREDEY